MHLLKSSLLHAYLHENPRKVNESQGFSKFVKYPGELGFHLLPGPSASSL